MGRELFIYWKVPLAQAEAAHGAAAALLQALAHAQPALQMRLLRRVDESGDKATFMETYRAPAPGVTAALQAAIQAEAEQAFAALGLPARHVEAFEDLPR